MSSIPIPIRTPKLPGGGVPALEEKMEEKIKRGIVEGAEAVAQEGQTDEDPAQTEEERSSAEILRKEEEKVVQIGRAHV